MISTLLASVWPYLAGAGALIAAALGVYAKGRKDASDKAKTKAADDYIKTRKRTDDEDYTDPDINAARDRLRDRGER